MHFSLQNAVAYSCNLLFDFVSSSTQWGKMSPFGNRHPGAGFRSKQMTEVDVLWSSLDLKLSGRLRTRGSCSRSIPLGLEAQKASQDIQLI